jgi:transcriptional regulator with XRE-family HTH domain
MVPVPPSQDSFGARLRRERERRQIALSSISANSKISVSLFEALEREDVSRWPVGIYRRAFIRAYAEAVGLDADATTREFLERFPDPAEPLAAVDKLPPAAAAVATLVAAPEAKAAATAAAKPAAAKPAVVRVTVKDAATRFIGGTLIAGMHSRWKAVGCDAGIIAAIGVTMFAVCGSFWLPLSVATVAYYVGGVLLLGNTPGVCLWAPSVTDSGQPGQRGDQLTAA